MACLVPHAVLCELRVLAATLQGIQARKLLAAVSQCTAAGQFVPDTTVGCTKYWQCTAVGQGAYTSCPAGTAWDASANTCNFQVSLQPRHSQLQQQQLKLAEMLRQPGLRWNSIRVS